jgi:hypothetical protein
MPIHSKPPESQVGIYVSTDVMHALSALSNSGATVENARKPVCFALSIRQAEENSLPQTPRRQNWLRALAGN